MKSGYIAAALLGFALFFVILHFLAYNATPSSIGVNYPKQLPDGSEAAEVYTGEKAVSMVKGIHWNPAAINVSDALVIVYSNGVRVWVSITPEAGVLLDKMLSKIMEYQGRVPFVPAHDLGTSGVRVYLMYDTNSPGKVHALWARGDLLVWTEVPGEVRDPTVIIEALVDGIRR